MLNKKLKNFGFTIVELLVVIVVIGILAAITIVSYSGITRRAVIAGLQSDLNNNSKLLKLYNAEHGYYPNSLDENKCPLTPDVDKSYCLKTSSGTDLNYNGINQSFSMTAIKNSIKYRITESSSPTLSQILTGPDWVTIGSQVWAAANSNVGVMINRSTAQTDNSIIEKYCYNNTESNCTTYGGIYRWNEVMQYVTTEGAQGICPAGSHIPSDDDWKILEMHLGMTYLQTNDWELRGTDQGTQLKSGGVSGLNLLLAGGLGSDGFFDQSTNGSYWSSSEAGIIIVDGEVVSQNYGAMSRTVYSDYSTAVDRSVTDKQNGVSLRCIGD